jgi:hypothetical protein
MKQPKIRSCMRNEKYGKSCSNKNIFICDPIVNYKGEIIEWEVECPMCGTIWWINTRKKAVKPQLYLKEFEEEYSPKFISRAEKRKRKKKII